MSKSVLAIPIILAAGLFGQTPAPTPVQTVETIPLRAILSSANESVQPANPATGAVTIWLHVVRDSSGNVVSGSVDASVGYTFTTANSATAMHIHKGATGADGPIVLPFTLARSDVSGTGNLPMAQTNFPSTAVSLDTINAIVADPSQFYFNIHTPDAPAGVMRGQLQRAETVVRMAIMQPENETPPIGGQPWKGVATVMLVLTRDGRGAANSAYVIFDMAYSGFPAGTNFTGFHIHNGAAQVSGPVVIDSGLKGPVAGGADGTGVLHYETEVDLGRMGISDVLNSFSNTPTGLYINAHTSDFPGGAIRAQLQRTDRMDFQVTMTPDQEVPPVTGLAASAPSRVTVYTLRNSDASIAAGTVVFDENPRFPTGNTITATHIHDGVAGQNGPVTIDSRLRSSPLLVNDGAGNIYRLVTVADAKGIATLTSLVTTPYKQYLNLHTSANPGGAVRSQMSAATTSLPTITGVQTAAPYASLTTLAPGSNFVINGTNLAFVGTDLSGIQNLSALPGSLNGVSVTIGGVNVPLVSVAPGEIRGQVPFNVPTGQLPVVVTTSNGASTAFMVRVASASPAILYGPTGVVATRQSDNSAIGASSPASAGDVVIVTATGLGQTNPALTSGNLVDTSQPYTTQNDVGARIGGINTTVLYARALPGLPGLYQVAIVVPQGVASGNAPLLLQVGLTTSNVVAIAIK